MPFTLEINGKETPIESLPQLQAELAGLEGVDLVDVWLSDNQEVSGKWMRIIHRLLGLSNTFDKSAIHVTINGEVACICFVDENWSEHWVRGGNKITEEAFLFRFPTDGNSDLIDYSELIPAEECVPRSYAVQMIQTYFELGRIPENLNLRKVG